MTAANRTIADPTRPVDASDYDSSRAVLLIYHDSAAHEHSKLIDVPQDCEITLGRSRKSTVHLDVEGVSRSHCIVRRVGNRYQVEDLGSRNGTNVNGETIEAATILASGDEIGIGPFRAVLSITSSVTARRRLGTTAYLNERLVAECDRGHRYSRTMALMMMRLQGESTAVDEALERVATRVRSMDTLCEYSPDEFAIIVPEVSHSGANQLAQRLTRVARSVLGSEADAVRTGFALFPDNGTSPDELVGRARAALMAAKTNAVEISTPPEEHQDDSVIIHDPQMKRVFQLLKKVAASNITVLVLGETGTGKEIIAAAIHKQSSRQNKPYVRLNCASIPETLLESELFGHEKGAFTGATSLKKGYFEAAKEGTIFLDEIGEISANVQAKLLRVLENRTITRVGGTSEIHVDVRILCATNRDLEVEVREGRFREDLYYRISAFSLLIPALRDRPTEVLPLCEHFLRMASQQAGVDTPVISESARERLTHYDWPGNVRQLRNAMERAIVLATDGAVEVADLPDRVRAAMQRSGSTPAPLIVGEVLDVRDKLADVEKTTIEDALASVGGNQTKAAKQIGISRRALIYKMEKYGLKEPPASRRGVSVSDPEST